MSASATMEDLKHLRVDQVGGLAVPSALRRVFEAYKQGKAAEEEFGRAKDEAIRHVIAKQELIGYPILTDGELRRRNFQESFSKSVSGFDVPDEDKSMEGVSLQPLVRAEQNFAAPGPAIGQGATSSSAFGSSATCRWKNTDIRARSRRDP